MKFEIKHKFTGKVICSRETKTLGLTVEAAVKRGVDLRSANLNGVNLRSAYLGYANLRSADLGGADLDNANLRNADLSGADLSDADLRNADLSGADLSDADLRNADLRNADLSDADLSDADLSDVDLSDVDLSNADLSNAYGIDAERCTDLLMLLDQPGAIRAYKLVNQKSEGPYNGGIKYEIGKLVSVRNACADVTRQCAKGINLATLPWCLREWRKGYKILICEFTAKDIAAIPTATDGKFRVHRCRVVAEKDVSHLFLEQDK